MSVTRCLRGRVSIPAGPLRARWPRTVLSVLAIPSILGGCTALPQAGTSVAASPSPSAIRYGQPAAPPDPRAVYPSKPGNPAKLNQDVEGAIREYLSALR